MREVVLSRFIELEEAVARQEITRALEHLRQKNAELLKDGKTWARLNQVTLLRDSALSQEICEREDLAGVLIFTRQGHIRDASGNQALIQSLQKQGYWQDLLPRLPAMQQSAAWTLSPEGPCRMVWFSLDQQIYYLFLIPVNAEYNETLSAYFARKTRILPQNSVAVANTLPDAFAKTGTTFSPGLDQPHEKQDILAALPGIPGKEPLVLQMDVDQTFSHQFQLARQYGLWALIIGFLLLLGTTLLLLEKTVLARIHYLAKAFTRVSSLSDLSKRVEDPAGDELTELTTGVNQMLDRLERSERSVRKAESNYRGIFNSIPDCIVIIDPDTGLILDANASSETLFGYSPESMRGQQPLGLSQGDPPFSQDQIDEKFHLAATEGPQFFEWRGRHKNGRVFWVEISLRYARLFDQSGIIAVIRDVDARKRKQEDLQRIRAAVEDASDAIFTTDAEQNVTFVNVAFTEKFRYTLDTMNEAGLAALWKEEGLAEKIVNCCQGFESWEGEAVMRTANRDEFPALVRATPVLNEKIEVIGALLVINDITERKSLEQQLLQSQKLESIGQLAAGIAHEINTPTQYIGDNMRFMSESFEDLKKLYQLLKTTLEEAQNDALSSEQVQTLRREIEAGDFDYLMEEVPQAANQSLEGIEHVARIVRAMKEFSHPGVEEKTAVDINYAIESTITIARNEWKYVAEIETDFDRSLPHVPCLPSEINQVILNLIINACHAIDEARGKNKEHMGKIRIVTRKNENQAEIRLSDDGPGVPLKIQSRVFDPFFTTKEVGKGSGQGLAISRSVIVEKHAGELELESEPGKGATFIIRLPLDEMGGDR